MKFINDQGDTEFVHPNNVVKVTLSIRREFGKPAYSVTFHCVDQTKTFYHLTEREFQILDKVWDLKTKSSYEIEPKEED